MVGRSATPQTRVNNIQGVKFTAMHSWGNDQEERGLTNQNLKDCLS